MKVPKIKRKGYAPGGGVFDPLADTSKMSVEEKAAWDIQKKKWDTISTVAPAAGNFLGNAIDNNKNQTTWDNMDVANAGVTGAIKGAGALSALGPLGMVTGAIAGLGTGIINANSTNKQRKSERADYLRNDSLMNQNTPDYIAHAPTKNSLNEGGQVKGAGTGKSDSIKAELDDGGFVVPAENAAIAKVLRQKFLGDSANAKAQIQEGTIPAKVSNGEHYFSPDEVQTLLKNGVDLNKLAPDSNQQLESGHPIINETEPMAGGRGLANKNQLNRGGAPIAMRVASGKKWRVPGYKAGGESTNEDKFNSYREQLLKYAENKNVLAYLKGLQHGESNGSIDAKNPDSTATGQYQFVKATRDLIKERYGVDAWSKDKTEQALAAIANLHRLGQLKSVTEGDFESADKNLAKHEWTSLPGGSQPNSNTDTIPSIREKALKDKNLSADILGTKTNDTKGLTRIADLPENNPLHNKIIPAAGGLQMEPSDAYKTGDLYSESQRGEKVLDKGKSYAVDQRTLGLGNAIDIPIPNEKRTASAPVDETLPEPEVANSPLEKIEKMPTLWTEDSLLQKGRQAAADLQEKYGKVPDEVLRTSLDATSQARVKNAESLLKTKKGDASTSDADKILAGAQILGAGINFGSIGPRPVDTLDPQKVRDTADSIRDAQTGMSLAEQAKIEADLELTRRNTNSNILSLSGGDAATALGNMNQAQATKNKGIVDLGIDNEHLMLQKKMYRDSMVNNLASDKRTLFNDKMNAFEQNQSATSALMNAGISNLMGSIDNDKWLAQLGNLK